ncbi:hypothetical protein [Hymenobacter sp. BT730]|uniref:hypothetical protein n=1 Tax=Hymenobacter sp. BT730 TaxID=3063332 RepID=UPI0026DF71C0|nr:hypothetical protein [Hymenobacter sp. BT730]
MKLKSFTLALICGGLGFATVSCDKEEVAATANPKTGLKAGATSQMVIGEGNLKLDKTTLAASKFDCSFGAFGNAVLDPSLANAVVKSPCGPTPFNYALSPYVAQFGDLEWEWYDLMATIAQYYTYFDTSAQYFGADGSLTNFADKHKRNLESFWNMPGEITLKGQHTKTLQNRDAIAAVYINATTATTAEAYENADYLIENVIKPSTAFQNSPLLSLDGFATTGKMIVIGDGIVQIMTDAGVDRNVTFAGILGHEWAHQVQFKNYTQWYGPRVNTAEQTRKTELEADVFSSYYLTHKRGATYNWKSAAEFFELFYNIGDCSFTSTGHHGTPNQRLAASRLGWIIAQEVKPMGHILSANDMHSLFMAALNNIIENKIDSSAAFASLKDAQLKAVYGNVLQHEKELKSIMNGELSQEAIENL